MTTFQIPIRRGGPPRVLPRRRGDTTPTTVAPPPPPVAAPLPALPPVRQRAESSVPPVSASAKEIIANQERAESKPAPVNNLYRQLAETISSGELGEHGSLALFSAAPGVSAGEVVSLLIQALAESNGRVALNLARDSASAAALEALGAGRATAREMRAARQTIRARLAELREAGTLVLCDGTAADSPLGVLLSQTCDACLVLVELGQTESRAARRVVASLRAGGGRVIGCIVAERET